MKNEDGRIPPGSSFILQPSSLAVPPGRWAVGVSGGADSVALLSLLRMRSDLSLVVAHLDHQTRGGASEEDAQFVQELCSKWGVECVVQRRDQIEPELTDPPGNLSARFRAVRLEFFRRLVRERSLQGVILAHHADDQAETILLRLLRGSGPEGLGGMSPRSTVAGLLVLRPLLGVRGSAFREHLQQIGQSWREDPTNISLQFERGRVRQALLRHPELIDPLLEVGNSCAALRQWIEQHAPQFADSFAVAELASQPRLLARPAARRWLLARGAPPDELVPAVVDRLIEMASDAASPPRHFPGRLLVHRRAGRIEAA